MGAVVRFPKTPHETPRADAMCGRTIRIIGGACDVDGKGLIGAADTDRAAAGRPQTRLRRVAWPTQVYHSESEYVGRADKPCANLADVLRTYDWAAKAGIP